MIFTRRMQAGTHVGTKRVASTLVALGALVATIVAALLGAPRVAHAHDARPGVLSIVERDDRTYTFRWTAPVDARREEDAVRVRWPTGCTAEATSLRCARELQRVDFDGLSGARVVVILTRRDGRRLEGIATSDSPEALLDAPAGLAWIPIGVEHVVLGLDHVAFVLGLLLVLVARRRVDTSASAPSDASGRSPGHVSTVVATSRGRARFLRALVGTLTAFTLAHSVTLALAALDLVRLPSGAVEATIAASVVLVAREAFVEADTLTRRRPWLVASVFGLVHGLGFAGALGDLGLPEDGHGLVVALLGFNVGVELGQVAIVLGVLGLALFARRVISETVQRRAHALACYALGGAGAIWCVDRVAGILGG
ncbi:MAG: HupE/UreJ family protein [Myxococcota bacterium]|jgi:hypothetical protein|nr:HupE/UreJ family protein [Myxococcota bacterium]